MADIELVIKIPNHLYKLLKEFPSDSNEGNIENVLMKAVENGTPLPKGHGRLVDEKDLSLMTVHLIDGIFVCNAPTIIERDDS